MFPESITVGSGESGHEEGHTEGVGDPREGDKDPARADGAAPHEPRRHARLYGQPGLRLCGDGGKCVNSLQPRVTQSGVRRQTVGGSRENLRNVLQIIWR